jgi:hypothetical protein
MVTVTRADAIRRLDEAQDGMNMHGDDRIDYNTHSNEEVAMDYAALGCLWYYHKEHDEENLEVVGE